MRFIHYLKKKLVLQESNHMTQSIYIQFIQLGNYIKKLKKKKKHNKYNDKENYFHDFKKKNFREIQKISTFQLKNFRKL